MNAQTPAQIFRSLKQLPALQRDEAIASTYVGLLVVWKTRFFEALDINRGSVKQFSFIQRGWRMSPRSCGLLAGCVGWVERRRNPSLSHQRWVSPSARDTRLREETLPHRREA